MKQSSSVKIKKSKGSAYFGEFVGKEKSGMGIMMSDSGRVYEGYWKNDQKDGKGYEKYVSGNIYIGQYSMGKP